MSLVLRVKRKRLTVFITAEPTDTIADVKQRLEEMAGQLAAAQRLFRENEMLDDSKTLAELRLEDDSVLALAHQIQGSSEWEAVDISPLDEARAGGRSYYE